MQLRKNISSYFLLAIYLLVIAHQSISHTHTFAFDGDVTPKHSHQHEDFKGIHHKHHFHIGIFHFFGHLFESISQTSDNADEHLVFIQNTSQKKVLYNLPIVGKYYDVSYLQVIKVDAESLPDPPYYHIPYLQNLTRSTSPLRAPPFLV